MILIMLHDFLLPWISIKQSVRAGNSENLDEMWKIAMPWFMATGKKLYRDLCIDVSYVNLAMVPSLRAVHRANRTYSHKGNEGSNVAYDHLRETRNADLKGFLSDGAKPADIDPCITILNGIGAVTKDVRGALGVDPEQGGETLREHAEDVDAVVARMRELLPACIHDAAPNPFGRGEPWRDVEKQHDAAEGVVRAHLGRADVAMYSDREWNRFKPKSRHENDDEDDESEDEGN